MIDTNPGRQLRLLAKIRTRTCQQCGKEFETRSEGARFCNDPPGRCRALWHNEQRKKKRGEK